MVNKQKMETGENCPMWNHRSSAPPGPLPLSPSHPYIHQHRGIGYRWPCNVFATIVSSFHIFLKQKRIPKPLATDFSSTESDFRNTLSYELCITMAYGTKWHWEDMTMRVSHLFHVHMVFGNRIIYSSKLLVVVRKWVKINHFTSSDLVLRLDTHLGHNT